MKLRGRYKVLTLDSDSLAGECRKLQMLVTDSGYKPDVVLAIANGGIYVGDNMFADTRHAATLLQRPSTKRKTGLMGKFLKVLPRSLKNTFRIAEAMLLQKQSHTGRTKVIIPDLPLKGRLLVVDDAIDSGSTMRAVVKAVEASYPHLEIRTAVLTVTTDSPIINPDYTLYRSHTLLRFPWSLDA